MLVSRLLTCFLKKHNRLLRLLCFFLPFLLSISLLSSCQPRDSAEYIFDNYLYRLSNSLQVNRADDFVTTPLLLYPSRREIEKDIPSININLIEFLRLSDCELQRHVGQRNGGLGRVMVSTQQLIYDAKFLALAQQCLAQLSPDSSLASTVELAYQHKKKYLPDSVWNATFASKEFAYLFSLGTKPLSSATVSEQPRALVDALSQLTEGYKNLLHYHPSETFLENIESHYQIIESSKRLGELRLSMRIMIDTLQQADQLLLARIEQKPLCRNQQSNAQFTIVSNVFYKYYIGEVQPYISALYRQSKAIFLAVDGLLALQQTPQELTSFWNEVYGDDNSEWQRFNKAIKIHTLHWQSLLKQCGKLPS